MSARSPDAAVGEQAEALANAAAAVGRALRSPDDPLRVTFQATEVPLDRVARELAAWLARDRRDLGKVKATGDLARLSDARRDRARLWEIASRSLRSLGEDLIRAEELAKVISAFPTAERIALDAESSVDQRAVLENEFAQIKLRVRLGLLRLAACASADGDARWEAEIERTVKQQTQLELERVQVVRSQGEGHAWQDKEALGKQRVLSGEARDGQRLIERALAERAHYDALHKFGPLAPLRRTLERIEQGNVSFEAFTDRARASRWSALQSLLARRTAFVLGSSHQDDDIAIAKALFRTRGALDDLLLVVAPRNILEVRDVVADLHGAGFRVESLGELSADGSPEVVVLDVLGFLMPLYQRARGAFIGGGLHGVRDHNYFEPLLFGTPTWTGPHHFWSPERWRLLQAHAPDLVHELDATELERLAGELAASDTSEAARAERRRRLRPFLEEAERRALEAMRTLPTATLALLRQLRVAPEEIETCEAREDLLYLNLVKLVTLPDVVVIEGDWQPYWRLTNHVGYLLDLLDG